MALVSQFVNAGDLRASRSAGIRDQAVLFELGRQLRDLDQQYQFNQAANPLRLSQLEQDLINSREINRGRILYNDFAQQTFDTRVDFTELGTELRRDEATVSRATVPDKIQTSREGVLQAQQATRSQELSLFQQEQVLPSAIQAQIANNQSVIQQLEIGRKLLEREGVNVDAIIPPELGTVLENMNKALAQVGAAQVARTPTSAPAGAPAPVQGQTTFEQAFNPLLQGDALGVALDRGATGVIEPAAIPYQQQLGQPSRRVPLDSFGNPLGTTVNLPPRRTRLTPESQPTSDVRIMSEAQTRIKNPRGGTPVSDGGSIVRKLFPGVRVTQTRRSASSRLGKANRGSWHISTDAAVDVAPVPGITFQQFVNRFVDEGYVILEAIDEVRAPSSHSTGPHWHIVLGEKRR